jgi:hypothetical protein
MINEQELEAAAEKYVNQFTFGIEHPRKVCKNAYINGAKSDAAKEYHTKEARGLIEEMIKAIKYFSKGCIIDDKLENAGILITKAENFLNNNK